MKIYTSYKISKLIKKVCKIIKKKNKKYILSEDIFIIENYNIAQWIKIFITKQIGICANIKFYTMETFFWKTIKKKNNFKNIKIFWKIFLYQDYNFIKNFFENKFDNKKKFYFL
ncbi:exodeoxyribonuclease V subunit gamma [Buchnera aphidicola (Astegopteryx bambusae)]|uniref:exodeoxyribonuclease V subunit gamma n=1 Tax=Buchnera aphidicola TaxID=9 RepID=UPI0031B81C13